MKRTVAPGEVGSHKFTLSFRNGKRVSAVLHGTHSTEDCSILWSGAVELLPFRPEEADPLLLRVLFRSFARELGARFKEVAMDDVVNKGLTESETHWLWRDNLDSLTAQASFAAC